MAQRGCFACCDSFAGCLEEFGDVLAAQGGGEGCDLSDLLLAEGQPLLDGAEVLALESIRHVEQGAAGGNGDWSTVGERA